MKTVFFDTNVMIDIIGRRQQFCSPSLQIMSLADRGILRVCVSAMSYTTASFILSRDNKQMDVVSEFAKFAQITTASPVDADTIDKSIRSQFSDFEDAMQYFSALRENVDYIVTRNKRTSRMLRFLFLSHKSLSITFWRIKTRTIAVLHGTGCIFFPKLA